MAWEATGLRERVVEISNKVILHGIFDLICHIQWKSQVSIIIHRIGNEDFVGDE
jgi:hypothetical protein